MNTNISVERKKYLKNIKNTKIKILLTQVFIFLGFLAIWESLAIFNIIDSFITSQPSRIYSTIISMISEGLFMHIGVTVYETVIGFLLRYFFRNYHRYYFMVV